MTIPCCCLIYLDLQDSHRSTRSTYKLFWWTTVICIDGICPTVVDFQERFSSFVCRALVGLSCAVVQFCKTCWNVVSFYGDSLYKVAWPHAMSITCTENNPTLQSTSLSHNIAVLLVEPARVSFCIPYYSMRSWIRSSFGTSLLVLPRSYQDEKKIRRFPPFYGSPWMTQHPCLSQIFLCYYTGKQTSNELIMLTDSVSIHTACLLNCRLWMKPKRWDRDMRQILSSQEVLQIRLILCLKERGRRWQESLRASFVNVSGKTSAATVKFSKERVWYVLMIHFEMYRIFCNFIFPVQFPELFARGWWTASSPVQTWSLGGGLCWCLWMCARAFPCVQYLCLCLSFASVCDFQTSQGQGPLGF